MELLVYRVCLVLVGIAKQFPQNNCINSHSHHQYRSVLDAPTSGIFHFFTVAILEITNNIEHFFTQYLVAISAPFGGNIPIHLLLFFCQVVFVFLYISFTYKVVFYIYFFIYSEYESFLNICILNILPHSVHCFFIFIMVFYFELLILIQSNISVFKFLVSTFMQVFKSFAYFKEKKISSSKNFIISSFTCRSEICLELVFVCRMKQ